MQDPRDQFGPVAEKYLTSPSHANEAELAHIVKVSKPRGGPVLDIATGAGHTAYAFASFASEVIATDITPEMLQIVEREAKQRGLTNVRTALVAAESLEFADESFEGVTCRVAAHHFRDVNAFLREAYRVLKPAGWLLIVDTVGIDEDAKADEDLDRIEFMRDPSHVRDYTPTRWREMVGANGFVIEHDEVFPRPHNVPAWLDRMNVTEPTRSKVIDMVIHSAGWLREYLRPHGEHDSLTFRLHQIILLARKPK